MVQLLLVCGGLSSALPFHLQNPAGSCELPNCLPVLGNPFSSEIVAIIIPLKYLSIQHTISQGHTHTHEPRKQQQQKQQISIMSDMFPRTVEEIAGDYATRRAGMLRALTDGDCLRCLLLSPQPPPPPGWLDLLLDL